MRKIHTLLLVLGVVFLGWVLWRTGVGELWRELGELGWGLLPLILCEGFGELLHTVAWRFCLSGGQRRLPFPRLFQIRMAGYAINYITPTAGLGGEISRVGFLAASGPATEAAGGVLIDKACLALSHLLVVLAGSGFVLWLVPLAPALRVAMIVAIVPLAAGILGFILLQKHGKLGSMVRWLAARKFAGSRLSQAAEKITVVDGAFRAFYRERPRDFRLSILWHVLGFSTGILQLWLFLLLLRQRISVVGVGGAWLMGLWFDIVAFAVPLNLGTLEGSRVLIFQTLGYGTLVGATCGVVQRLAQISCTVFGLANYGLLLRERRTPAIKAGKAEPTDAANPPFLARDSR
jgi:uncharacterized protein (TIRG00374 family)